MEKENPLVSVIVITYNSSKYVIETLESADLSKYKTLSEKCQGVILFIAFYVGLVCYLTQIMGLQGVVMANTVNYAVYLAFILFLFS